MRDSLSAQPSPVVGENKQTCYFVDMRGGHQKDYSEEASALFARIAARHGLEYVVGTAPVEVIWSLPAQPGLSHEITLCLQNRDELNFGVGPFWSTFFPFPEQKTEFEEAVDAWIRGDARVQWRGRSQILQVKVGSEWRDAAIYRRGCFGQPRLPTLKNHPGD